MGKVLVSILVWTAPVFAADLSPYTGFKVSQSSSLSIYSIGAPKPLDWSTPSNLVDSILSNSFARVGYYHPYRRTNRDNPLWVELPAHPIGHMAIALRCARQPEIVTGMTTENDFEATSDIFLNGFGLGIILKTQAGRLETAREVLGELDQRRKYVGNVVEMRMKISDAQCAQVRKFIEEYVERGIDLRYGSLVDRPLRGDGAGCAAFAFSFFRPFGLLPVREEDLRPGHFANAWRRPLEVSSAYIGNHAQGAEIGIWSLAFNEHSQWTLPGHSSRVLTFWDPQLFSEWVKRAWSGEERMTVYRMGAGGQSVPGELPLRPIQNGLIQGVEVDLRGMPLRLDPIWDYVPRL